MDTLRHYLSAPVNNAPLVVWRVLFGLLMLIESWGAIATGWVKRNLVDPAFTFNFIGFDFLQAIVGPQAYGYFFIMGLAALGVMLGLRYRWSALLLALMWSGAYFVQKTSYNNHYYLAMLLCWWMVLVPAHRRFSLDARRGGTVELQAPRWIWTFAKAQMLIVFTYGALAKLYPGWLKGEFIAQSFGAKAAIVGIGPLLQQPLFQQFITYSAIAFDGLIIPMLMWRPTRRIAFVGLVLFNVFNSVVFQIGIFPYLVLAMTIFFFEPDWVERFFRVPRSEGATVYGGTATLSRWGAVALGIYMLVQVALPLRHHFIPGDVNWREEGHRLSWRMMLRSKGGTVRIEAYNPISGVRERVQLRDHLTQKQALRIATHPYFVWRFAQYLEEYYQEQGWEEVEVYATRNLVWLNGVGPKPLIDPEVDLTAVEWAKWGKKPWILDFED